MNIGSEMQEISSNNKRIAKNTVSLYIRMLVTMFVGLYTSRVVLQTLGVADFGIYNVVGGIVTMCVFISNTLSSASQRFFAFEIGRNDTVQLRKVFSASLFIYVAFVLVILILAETVGRWFVENKLNIPPSREAAAYFVYHFSGLSFLSSIIRVPYNALIIARERMGFYAWISIVEAALKLLIVYLLVWLSFDKLKLYAVLMFFVVFLITLIYVVYCRIKFYECRVIAAKDKCLYVSLFQFAGWNLFGSLANVGLDQGLNILLNIFFGPVVNAARGIAFQVKSLVTSFAGNVQIAATPQIIKYYAADDLEKMKILLFKSSRMSYYLLFLVALPILLEMKYLLALWLTEVPEYTVLFARLIVINILVDCMSGTIIPTIQATGQIKRYQITVGTTLLLAVPISYVFLKLGFPPEITMIVAIFLGAVCLFLRLAVIRDLLGIKIAEYAKEVITYNIAISGVSLILPLMLYYTLSQSFVKFILVSSVSLISAVLTIYFIGLKREERRMLTKIISEKIKISAIWN